MRSARSALAVLRNPAARRAVGAVFAEQPGAAAEAALRGPESTGLIRRDETGAPAVDEAFLAGAIAALDRVLGPLAVLDGERIAVSDLAQADVDAAVAAVARRTLAAGEEVSERELNGRLALFVEDVAFFRRHAVDTGVVDRSADGSAYWLVAG